MEVSLSAPYEEAGYFSTFPLEHGLGHAYATGKTDLLGHYASLGNFDVAANRTIYPDWPVLLEALFQWTGIPPENIPWIEYATDRWLDAFVMQFGRDSLLRPSKALMPQSLESFLDGEDPDDYARLLNSALLHRGAQSAARLRQAAELPTARFDAIAEAIRYGFAARHWDAATGTFRVTGDVDPSPWLNGAALSSGVWPEDADTEGYVTLLRKKGTNCPAEFEPMLIDACVGAGAVRLALDLISFAPEYERRPMIRVIAESLGGVDLTGFSNDTVRIAPPPSGALPKFSQTLYIPEGRLTVEHDPKTGFALTVPPAYTVVSFPREGAPIMAKKSISHEITPLTEPQRSFLDSTNWEERVGNGMGVWVSIDEQVLRIIEDGQITYQALCATAEKGAGFQMNSLQTPLGWHEVSDKIGDGEARGQVFRSRTPTRQIWRPGDDVVEDLVLTRILWLNGLEQGKNRGGKVDSRARSIYIHGTNDEARLGIPTSHGCVRLSNDDVVEAFERIPEGTPVLISDGEQF